MSNINAMKGKIALGRGQIPIYADDTFWRDTLEGLIGLRSLSGEKITEPQLARVIDFLASKGAVFSSGAAKKSGKPYKAKASQRRSEFYEIPDGPLAPIKRKLCKLWKLLQYDLTKIDTRVQRENGCETLLWCQDKQFLNRLATDLTKRLEAKEKKRAAAGGDA